MNNGFCTKVKIEKNALSLVKALLNFENLAHMIDGSGIRPQFVPFYSVNDKVYFSTTILGKTAVISTLRGERDFTKHTQYDATTFFNSIIKSNFDKCVLNLSNPKMVAYSICPETGMLIAVRKLYNENGQPLVDVFV